MKPKTVWTLLLISALSVNLATAGLVSVNFTNTTASSVGGDGTGLVGGGSWNRIIETEFDQATALLDSGGTITNVSLTASLSLDVNGRSSANGNNVQNESWIGIDPSALLIVTVSGLLAGQVYEVVVYSDRQGSGNATDTVTVNGVAELISNPGVASTSLPGAEGTDYVRFFAEADSSGELAITASALAGLQIQGRLTSTESGSRMDAVASKSQGVFSGKGDNRYRKNGRDKKDTLRIRAKNKASKLYPVAQNDGSQVDHCYFRTYYRPANLKVNVRDLTDGTNVTADSRTARFQFPLDNGESRQFRVNAKIKKKRIDQQRFRFCVQPSTRESDFSDCAAYSLERKR